MSERVLLGVSDKLLAQCLANLMTKHYQVHLPQSSHHLLHEAEQIKPQLLILDDSLEQDSTELCLTLSKRLPNCRLMFLSSNWLPSLAAQLQAHGVDTVLRKPFSTEKILQTTRQLLDAAPC